MANSSADLYAMMLKKGMSKEQAFFAVLDHFHELHCFDRNRYDERIRKLEATVARLDKEGHAE